MARTTNGEFELVLGNRQLLSGFFIVVVLFGVFFRWGMSWAGIPRRRPLEMTAQPQPRNRLRDDGLSRRPSARQAEAVQAGSQAAARLLRGKHRSRR